MQIYFKTALQSPINAENLQAEDRQLFQPF
jgi:hypothetical protein